MPMRFHNEDTGGRILGADGKRMTDPDKCCCPPCTKWITAVQTLYPPLDPPTSSPVPSVTFSSPGLHCEVDELASHGLYRIFDLSPGSGTIPCITLFPPAIDIYRPDAVVIEWDSPEIVATAHYLVLTEDGEVFVDATNNLGFTGAVICNLGKYTGGFHLYPLGASFGGDIFQWSKSVSWKEGDHPITTLIGSIPAPGTFSNPGFFGRTACGLPGNATMTLNE